jgi:hypothetical protein
MFFKILEAQDNYEAQEKSEHIFGLSYDRAKSEVKSMITNTPIKCRLKLWFKRNRFFLVGICVIMLGILYAYEYVRNYLKVLRLGKFYYRYIRDRLNHQDEICIKVLQQHVLDELKQNKSLSKQVWA